MLRACCLGKERLELLAHLAGVNLATSDLNNDFIAGADDFKTDGTGDIADTHEKLFGGVLADGCLTRQRNVDLDQRACVFKAIRFRLLNRLRWAGGEVVAFYKIVEAISKGSQEVRLPAIVGRCAGSVLREVSEKRLKGRLKLNRFLPELPSSATLFPFIELTRQLFFGGLWLVKGERAGSCRFCECFEYRLPFQVGQGSEALC